MGRALVIGAAGQIGTDLVIALQSDRGKEVVAADIREPDNEFSSDIPFEYLDVLSAEDLEALIAKHQVDEVYHLAAMLSATAEQVPMKAWRLNMEGLFHVLELARRGRINKVFWPSSIAVFGPTTPKKNTPQHTITDPTSVYGISKFAGERWCAYYHANYGVDVRSLRYPGLISYRTQPGGGTTDYAVDIFHTALSSHPEYTSYLKSDTRLPMMYMPDAIKATLNLMEAPEENVRIRSSYNIAGVSFSPEELASSIKKRIKTLTIRYQPDERQKVAESWPESIDDSHARKDWGWEPEYDIDGIVEDMLFHLKDPVS